MFPRARHCPKHITCVNLPNRANKISFLIQSLIGLSLLIFNVVMSLENLAFPCSLTGILMKYGMSLDRVCYLDITLTL